MLRDAASLSPDQIEQSLLLLDNAVDYAIFTTDPDGQIVLWSAGAERVLGWRDDEALGQPADLIFTPEDRAAGVPEREMATARREGRARDVRWHLRRDGARFWADGMLVALRDEPGPDGPTGRLRGYAKILRDETVRHEHEQALQTLNDALEGRVADRRAQVQALSAALGDADADARQRLASLLHDDLQQVLYGLHLGLDALARDLGASGHAPAAAHAHQLVGWAGRAMELTRQVTTDLAAPDLPDDTLSATLQRVARQIEDTYAVAVDAAVALDPDVHDPIACLVATQIVREWLFNAVKHAGAERIALTARTTDGGVVVSVADEGGGFDPVAPTAGTGLARTRQRAALLPGGRVAVDAAPGAGARLTLAFAHPDG